MKEVHPPIKIGAYRQDQNTTYAIDLKYRTREVHCNQASDLAALNMHAGMTSGNATCPLEWTVKTLEEKRRTIAGGGTVSAADCCNVDFMPIFIPDEPNIYTCPIPLHVDLGLGNDIRECTLRYCVRLMDGDKGKQLEKELSILHQIQKK